jgi:antirestriction protein ArdC
MSKKTTKKQWKSKSSTDIATIVTSKIIEGLNKNICPWTKPWMDASIGGVPQNYNSKREYHSSNRLLLTMIMMEKGYKFNYWVTYKGAKDLGGNVKRGESGCPITFWKFVERKKVDDNGDEQTKKIPFLRMFKVFNVEQCEGIEMPKPTKVKKVAKLKPIKDAEKIVKAYDEREEKLSIKIQTSNKAYYSPSNDLIVVPTMRQAVEKAKKVGQTANDGKQHFYSTLFHEMVHSTGIEGRCNRKGVAEVNFFGDHEYSKEELVAEIGSAILSFKSGLTSERVLDNTTAYCKGWAKKLKSDPKMIIWAGGQAEKGADYILNGKKSK